MRLHISAIEFDQRKMVRESLANGVTRAMFQCPGPLAISASNRLQLGHPEGGFLCRSEYPGQLAVRQGRESHLVIAEELSWRV